MTQNPNPSFTELTTDTNPTLKPGVATTEFWVHNVLQVTTVVAGLFGAVAPNVAAVIMTVLGSVYILARAIVKVADANANPVVTTVNTQPLAKMLLIGLMLLGSMSLGGCGAFATPTPMTAQDQAISQVTQSQELYLVAVTTITALHADHKISDGTMQTLIPIEQTVWAYLQAAQTAALAGKTVDAATQLQLFNDALLRLNAAYQGSTAPATKPAALNTSKNLDAFIVNWRVRTPAGNALEAIAAHRSRQLGRCDLNSCRA